MADHLDDLLRQAVAERVRTAPRPRPFDELPKEQITTMTPPTLKQRNLLIAAVVAVAVAGIGFWAISRGDDGQNVVTDPTSTTTSTTTQDEESATTTTSTSPSSTGTSTTRTTASSTTTAETTTSTTASSTTTNSPGTIVISYLCGNGDTGSADLTTDNDDEIDDIVNATDLCETLGGLTEITFTARCVTGDREFTVGATNGALPDFATIDFCENDT